MLVQSVIHINIRVPGHMLIACRDFYCNVLGLTVGPRPPFKSHGFWLYANDAPLVHLVEALPGEVPHAASNERSALDHVAFSCADLQSALARLQEHRIPYTISQVPGLNQTQVAFRDPTGLGIELSRVAAERSR